MNKATTNHFTRAFGNAMLAAALLMSTSGHHGKLKRTFSLPVKEAHNCQTKEKPLRGNALSFCFKSFT